MSLVAFPKNRFVVRPVVQPTFFTSRGAVPSGLATAAAATSVSNGPLGATYPVFVGDPEEREIKAVRYAGIS